MEGKQPVKEAWQMFCQQGRLAGYTFAQISTAWKESAVRKSMVEKTPEKERKKRRMSVDD